MANAPDEHEASRQWITERLKAMATAAGIEIKQVECVPNPKGFGDILVVRAPGLRLTQDISSETLDDLPTDTGEQAKMDVRLRDVISQITKPKN